MKNPPNFGGFSISGGSFMCDFAGTPRLETTRLILDKLHTDDTEVFYNCLMRDSEVNRFMMQYRADTLQQATEYIESITDMCDRPEYNYWAVRREGRFIGTVSLYASLAHRRGSVAYQLISGEWGKGYATEALRAAVRYAFCRLGLHRLEAELFSENIRSARVLKKCGFHSESTAKDKVYKDGTYHDVLTYLCFSERDDYV